MAGHLLRSAVNCFRPAGECEDPLTPLIKSGLHRLQQLCVVEIHSQVEMVDSRHPEIVNGLGLDLNHWPFSGGRSSDTSTSYSFVLPTTSSISPFISSHLVLSYNAEQNMCLSAATTITNDIISTKTLMFLKLSRSYSKPADSAIRQVLYSGSQRAVLATVPSLLDRSIASGSSWNSTSLMTGYLLNIFLLLDGSH